MEKTELYKTNSSNTNIKEVKDFYKSKRKCLADWSDEKLCTLNSDNHYVSPSYTPNERKALLDGKEITPKSNSADYWKYLLFNGAAKESYGYLNSASMLNALNIVEIYMVA